MLIVPWSSLNIGCKLERYSNHYNTCANDFSLEHCCDFACTVGTQVWKQAIFNYNETVTLSLSSLFLSMEKLYSEHFLGIPFRLFKNFVWQRITDEDSMPEMRIWSISLIKSGLKWCLHLERSLFSYLYRIRCMTAVGDDFVRLSVKSFVLSYCKRYLMWHMCLDQ